LCDAGFIDRPKYISRCACRTHQVAEIVHLLGYSIDSLPGARVMKRLGIPVSDDTVLQQSKRNISAPGTQELHS
jgi:hypothetical protein